MSKLRRLRRGAPVRCLDLFAGCGGLSLGFHGAGAEIVGAVEHDPIASRSHARNFHPGLPEPLFEAHAKDRDITKVEPEELHKELELDGALDQSVDVVVGGPPCQAFARVGRAKLREVAEHPEAFKQDPRSNLYLRYIEYVRKFQPLAVLMENVPDVLNFGGHNIAEEVCEVLEDLRYVCRYTLLNAAYYGVPQMRERMFLIAYARELENEVFFPKPTHWVDLPRGYEGSRQVALKALKTAGLVRDAGLFKDSGIFEDRDWYYATPPAASDSLRPAITAEEALEDLPKITLHLEGKLRRGARRFDTVIPYPADVEPSPYASLMRTWHGFENSKGIADHVIRYLPRDYKIFKRMKAGDQYPEAYQLATTLFTHELERRRAAGQAIREGSADYEALKKEYVPPYDDSKFPNKWRKMERHLPARTLMAHLGKDSYSHIHYDSDQARTISVREAARLQSFPDGFVLEGSMNPAFRQIGNAVPPLMSYALARVMFEALGVSAAPLTLPEVAAQCG